MEQMGEIAPINHMLYSIEIGGFLAFCHFSTLYGNNKV